MKFILLIAFLQVGLDKGEDASLEQRSIKRLAVLSHITANNARRDAIISRTGAYMVWEQLPMPKTTWTKDQVNKYYSYINRGNSNIDQGDDALNTGNGRWDTADRAMAKGDNTWANGQYSTAIGFYKTAADSYYMRKITNAYSSYSFADNDYVYAGNCFLKALYFYHNND